MAETVVYTPENNGGSVPAWMLAGNNGWGNGFGGGLGGGILGFLLGLAFGNGWGGFGGFGGFGGWGGNGAGAGFLSNQINNDSGRELLMNAITSQGEASRAATQNLATMLGQDFNLVNSGVSAIRESLSTIAANQGMNVMQVINAIQSGNAALASQLCQCCCENKLLVTSQGYENQIRTIEQTNTLGNVINANGQRNVDAIADLKTAMVKEFCDAKERDMQSKIDTQADIITQLRGQLDNDRQTAQLAALLAPISAKIAEIESKQPNTVPVAWPNIVAANATPYVGTNYGAGYGFYGNGITF